MAGRRSWLFVDGADGTALEAATGIGADVLVQELDHVRARFHVECTAARVLSVDCPYTWTDLEGLETDTRKARRLGYRAESAVHAEHAAVINQVLTPDATEVERARRVVEAFEEAAAAGRGRIEVDGSLVEVPIYLNAKRLLERAAELGVTRAPSKRGDCAPSFSRLDTGPSGRGVKPPAAAAPVPG